MVDNKHMDNQSRLEKTKEILERDFYWDRIIQGIDYYRFDKKSGNLMLRRDGTIEGAEPHPALKQTLINLGWDIK